MANRARQSERQRKYTPFTSSKELPRPDGYDEKTGVPYVMEGDSRRPFVPEPHYAVEKMTLVAYRIGRGGLKRRGVCTLKVNSADKRNKSKKYERISKLMSDLRRDGIPGVPARI